MHTPVVIGRHSRVIRQPILEPSDFSRPRFLSRRGHFSCRATTQYPSLYAERQTTKQTVVTITYDQLQTGSDDLPLLIEQAYGPDGLGVLTVSDVPGYPELRQQLLPLAAKFAGLPRHVHALYEDPASFYSFGWSHGKEKLEDGQVDLHKGSFYANPLFDEPPAPTAELAQRYPAYYGPNMWPRTHLPPLEMAFKLSGQLIIQVGNVLAGHCDRYVASRLPQVRPGSLQSVLQRSHCPKARLLHYFPMQAHETAGRADTPAEHWCGWHSDHGSLTGLMSAMYLRADGAEVSNPDSTSGLHVRDRRGNVVRIPIPPNHIAFQLGEAMQVASGGLLRATPHCVVAAEGPAAVGVSRNTLAVFMQPDVDEVMEAPAGVPQEQLAVDEWTQGVTFGEFSNRVLQKYYQQM